MTAHGQPVLGAQVAPHGGSDAAGPWTIPEPTKHAPSAPPLPSMPGAAPTNSVTRRGCMGEWDLAPASGHAQTQAKPGGSSLLPPLKQWWVWGI